MNDPDLCCGTALVCALLLAGLALLFAPGCTPAVSNKSTCKPGEGIASGEHVEKPTCHGSYEIRRFPPPGTIYEREDCKTQGQ